MHSLEIGGTLWTESVLHTFPAFQVSTDNMCLYHLQKDLDFSGFIKAAYHFCQIFLVSARVHTQGTRLQVHAYLEFCQTLQISVSKNEGLAILTLTPASNSVVYAYVGIIANPSSLIEYVYEAIHYVSNCYGSFDKLRPLTLTVDVCCAS